MSTAYTPGLLIVSVVDSDYENRLNSDINKK